MHTALYLLGILAVALYAGCFIFMIVSFLRAPYGYEDEHGFHMTKRPREPRAQPRRHSEDLPAPGRFA